MSEERKRIRVVFWATVVAIALALYVLSAGPAQILLIRKVPVQFTDPDGTPIALPMSMETPPIYESALYSKVYAPLGAVVETPVGDLLDWYLELFQNRIPFDSTRPPKNMVLQLDR